MYLIKNSIQYYLNGFRFISMNNIIKLLLFYLQDSV